MGDRHSHQVCWLTSLASLVLPGSLQCRLPPMPLLTQRSNFVEHRHTDHLSRDRHVAVHRSTQPQPNNAGNLLRKVAAIARRCCV
jgi:hypothetical protein